MSYEFQNPGSKPRLEWIGVDQIQVDRNYQRDIKPRRVQQILREFDWSKFGAVLLAEKDDGSLWVYDGQHRTEAAKLHPMVDKIPAQISAFEDARSEAEAFLGVNINRTAISTIERYYAGLEAGDADMMAVCAVLEQADCAVVDYQGASAPNKTHAVIAVSRAIKYWGDDAVIHALRNLRAAWPKDAGGLAGVIIAALASLHKNNTDVIDGARIVTVLQGLDRKQLSGDAEVMRKISGGTAETNIRRVLVAKYNQGRSKNQIELGVSR